MFCLLPLARLAAQDVSVGQPVWLLPEPASEVLPQPKSRLRVDYPDEMRQTSEMGYVIVSYRSGSAFIRYGFFIGV